MTLTFLRDGLRDFAPLMASGLVAISLVLGGCASEPPADDPVAVAAYKEANDPWEPLNRVVFDVNMMLDKGVVKPVAFVFKEVVPDPLRDNLRNFLDNLRTPVILANDLLQFEFERAGITIIRFLMNSTIGFGGIADVASEAGLPIHDEDFGQTMAVAGVDAGPYLMLPLLGPSNPRDGIGLVVDLFFDPLTYLASTEFGIARVLANGVEIRARRWDTINELERTSLDFYAAVRSLHRQRRKDEIRNGSPSVAKPAPMI